MSETSRRNFMAAAGAGAAATTVVALGTGSASAKPAAAVKGAKEPVVALVDDHKGGTVRLLVGDREVVVHDRDLATRILNAAGGK
jgi:anaerobic selenocysteine-containing dehydrogenase